MNNEALKIKILDDAFHAKLFNKNDLWKLADLEDVIISIPTKQYQINQSEILTTGLYPVVSQSQTLIEGYSNEEKKVFYPNDDCVIFGDHSKTIKYLNFPFVVGADGTKIFKPKNICTTKFLYYHLMYNITKMKSSGYTRNYKYLKELKINLPSIETQHLLVDKIEELFSLIDKKERNDQEKEKLKSILKEKILDSAIHGVLIQNNSQITSYHKPLFDVPSDWKWVTFSDLATIVRGGSPRPIKDYLTESSNGINWIKIGDTNPDEYYINQVKEKIKPEGMKKSRFVEKGSLLLTNSMSFGRSYILNVDGCIHDGWLNIKDKYNNFYNLYMVYLLSSKYFYNVMCDKSSGAVVSNLNIDKVKSMMIPLPPLEEQHKIVEKIEQCFELIEQL